MGTKSVGQRFGGDGSGDGSANAERCTRTMDDDIIAGGGDQRLHDVPS